MQGSPFAHRRVVVLGLGVHGGGAAVARWLARQGAQVTVTDLKTRVELAPSLKTLKGLPIRYVLGTHPMRLLSRCDLVVQNPAVPANHPFLKAAARLGVAVENEASLFLKLCPSQRVVAVTGTRGKSTTVSLLGAMLRHTWPRTVVAGNIRDTVLFDALDRLTPRTPLALELSSWQLELVGKHQLRIPLAVVTNVLPDHLNRYPSFAAYARAKSFIFTYQDKQDALVLNYDNPITRGFAQRARGRVYWVSLRRAVPRGCFVRGVVVHWRDGAVNERLFSVSDLVLTGEHNLYNALSAAAAARLMGVTPSSICQAIRSFQGLHDRLELVRTMGGVRFVNDTTATSPDATLSALASFGKAPIVLIAGGADKALPYNKLARRLRQSVSALVLLPGSATAKLQAALRGFPRQLLARSMPEAVKLARQLAPRGSVVLLSPGAASFGLFRHEFERGEAFRRSVRRLPR